MIPANILAKIKDMVRRKPELLAQIDTIGKELINSGIKVGDLKKINIASFDEAVANTSRDAKSKGEKPSQTEGRG